MKGRTTPFAGCVALAGFLLLAAATPRGAAASPVPDPCNMGIVCGFGIPPGQTGDPYIDYVANSQSNKKCHCEQQEEGPDQCVVDGATNCSFDLSFAFKIPAGKSIKYGGKCYTPGQSGPADFDVSGTGCSAAFTIAFTVYDNENCEGAGTTVSFGGVCVAVDEDCTSRSC